MNLWKFTTFIFGASTVVLAAALLISYSKTGTLTLDEWADIATVVGNAAVAISIVFILRQLQLQTQLAKASNSQSFVTLSSDFLLNVIGNDTLLEFYRTTGATYETIADEKDKAKYRHLVTWWLNFYENVVYQEKSGLLDKEVYLSWRKEMEGFVERRHVEKVWDELKGSYGDFFVSHFQPIIDKRRAYLAATATLSTLSSTLSSVLSPPPSSPPSSPPASPPSSPPASPPESAV